LHVLDGLAFGFHELGEPLTLMDVRKVFDGPLMETAAIPKKQQKKRSKKRVPI